MRLTFNCKSCSHKLMVNIDEKRYMAAICPDNHKNIFIIQSQLFEILFDIACISLINGDYREAVFNFYAAIERFREFFIKFSLYKKGMATDEIHMLWKNLANQSEKQLGAYYLMHSLTINEQINKRAEDKMIILRNEVIHKGKFPTQNEAKEFGYYVFERMKSDYLYLKNDDYLNLVAQDIISISAINDLIETQDYLPTTILCPGFQLVHDAETKFDFILNMLRDSSHQDSWYTSRLNRLVRVNETV
ncbi:Uncharacterised protein [Legionella feeleii]|uniref:Uncharacterized protein n=2 Tax=Legionella feeleii TaxID=453 RepID=A0A378IVL8_9GAMM|nr:Uncharacterised protein [Legionella feeleii]